MQILDRLRVTPAGVGGTLLFGVLVGGSGGQLVAQGRPMTVRVQVVQSAVSGAALKAGRALLRGAPPGRGARVEVGVATVAVVPDRRPVLTIQYYRN